MQVYYFAKEILFDWQKIQKERPLILNFTNVVVQNMTANILLALGASPLMSTEIDECVELSNLASGVSFNIGTLSCGDLERFEKSIILTKKLPQVFDPVGAGASSFRTSSAHFLLRHLQEGILKGNASEILSLVDHNIASRGVDASHQSVAAISAAKELLSLYSLRLVCITGANDFVIGYRDKILEVWKISHGHPFMSKVTGTGCALGGVISAFLAVNTIPIEAAIHALTFYSFAGEVAAKRSYGPGSFSQNFLDCLSSQFNSSENIRIEKWE
jgi:hydroxyethylthiazole kinase